MTLFWEQGYEATSLAQLRAATGLSSASLYGAFGSKAGLFDRAVAHYVAGPGQVTDVVGDESLAPREALRRMLHASIDMQSDPSHPAGCLIALSATVGPQGDDGGQARAAVATRRAADRQRIAACIERGVADGDLRDVGGVDGLVSLVYGFLLGVSTQLRDGVPPEDLHAAADAVVASLASAAA